MPSLQRVLVALEDSETASRVVVEPVANMAAARNDFEIHLFHALQPLPPQFMESPGSEDPSQEQQIEQRQAGQQNRWTHRARVQVAPLIENAKSQLTAANVYPREHRNSRVTVK
jgi:hypothetical protein